MWVWVVKDETSFPFGTLQEKGEDEYIGDCGELGMVGELYEI